MKRRSFLGLSGLLGWDAFVSSVMTEAGVSSPTEIKPTIWAVMQFGYELVGITTDRALADLIALSWSFDCAVSLNPLTFNRREALTLQRAGIPTIKVTDEFDDTWWEIEDNYFDNLGNPIKDRPSPEQMKLALSMESIPPASYEYTVEEYPTHKMHESGEVVVHLGKKHLLEQAPDIGGIRDIS